MFKRFLALLLAVSFSGAAFAAESDVQSHESRPRRGGDARRRGQMWPGARRGGASMLQRFKAENDIAKKFPEEYAKIEKQLFEAEQAMKELAKKAKVNLPESMENKIRVLKHKSPEPFAALVNEEDARTAAGALMKLAKDNDIELFPGGFRRRPGENSGERPAPEPRNNMRRSGRANLDKLRKLYPEEMKQLDQLRVSDPEAFRKGLRELNAKMEKQSGASETAK